jgi:hypothetical protein
MSVKETWDRDGFCFPVDLITEAEAAQYAEQVRRYELITRKAGGNLAQRWNAPKIHLLAPWADALVRDERLLDVASSLIGPDLLVWSTNLFWRRGQSDDELAWHQDALHYGWENVQGSTVRFWVALTPTNRANGTMRFAKGAHNHALVPHRRGKSLFVGLEVDLEILEADTVDVVLRPGQGSLHQGATVHSSGPSSVDADRICFAIDYIAPSVRPVPGPDSAMLVRGRDTSGYYTLETPPAKEFDSAAIRQFHEAVAIRDRRLVAVMSS